MNRFLKYINFAIAALCIAVLALVYWYAWRVLPQTSGVVQAPVAARATVVRDQRGVPHITAGSAEDAWFLQGYVTAQDRLFQMEFMRRQAAGELAGILGPAALPGDLEMRRLLLRRAAERQVRNMRQADRAVLAAYARGVNFFLETHAGRLPVEFTMLRFDPAPWTVADSVLAGLDLFVSLTSTWRDELLKSAMLASGDPAKVNFLFPLRTGAEPSPGSNAWVLAGSRTRSGKPLLASDPHLGYTFPVVWYQVHLKTPDFDVAGVSIPGLPAVVIGHNSRIAWGVTNLQFDVQDLYRERLNAAAGVALYDGKPERIAREQELIRIKGSAPREATALVTRHGPVILSEQGADYSLRWTALEPDLFQFPFAELDRAGNWTEFRAALERFNGPPQNFVYADTEGNIGYQVAGKLPIRRSWDGDVPADGTSAAQEWDGFIPFAELPASFNPPSGIIVTANQNPFPANYPYRVNGNFAPPDRAVQIQTLLAGKPAGWEPPGMLRIQTDVYSAFSDFLAKQLLAACEKRSKDNPQLAGAIQVLTGWNGQMRKGTPAPMLVTLTFQQLRKAIADRAAPGSGERYRDAMASVAVERLLRQRPRDWFPDFDLLLVRSLTDAIAEGAKLQGRDVTRWDYGRFQELSLRAPVVDQVPLIGHFFRIGPVPLSGSSTTVKQTTTRLGPSMRMVVDLGNLDASLMNIMTGESGQVLSSHFRDQWDAYYAGTSFPMSYHNVTGDTLQFQPETGR